ncbi:MAG TPA: hypothetical protein V6D23_01320 [Candidatus Obscuribacterales bacterium]
MQLKVVPQAMSPNSARIPARIFIRNGRLEVDCESTVICDELIDGLANRYFVQGQGFPVFTKDPGSGDFARDPATGRLILAGFVDLAAPEHEILTAIADHLLLSGVYEVNLED